MRCTPRPFGPTPQGQLSRPPCARRRAIRRGTGPRPPRCDPRHRSTRGRRLRRYPNQGKCRLQVLSFSEPPSAHDPILICTFLARPMPSAHLDDAIDHHVGRRAGASHAERLRSRRSASAAHGCVARDPARKERRRPVRPSPREAHSQTEARLTCALSRGGAPCF